MIKIHEIVDTVLCQFQFNKYMGKINRFRYYFELVKACRQIFCLSTSPRKSYKKITG